MAVLKIAELLTTRLRCPLVVWQIESLSSQDCFKKWTLPAHFPLEQLGAIVGHLLCFLFSLRLTNLIVANHIGEKSEISWQGPRLKVI